MNRPATSCDFLKAPLVPRLEGDDGGGTIESWQSQSFFRA